MALICMMRLVAEHINIVACVPPPKDNNTYKMYCDTAKQFNLPIISYEKSLKEEKFLNEIKSLEPDIAVVCSYGKLFPKEFLNVTKDGFINVHPSLLPKYRGANPYSHVLLNDEKETGVTLHFMDEHFDTGDIILQQKAPIYKNDTMGTIFNRLNFLGADLLFDVLSMYEESSILPRKKQPEGDFPKAPSIKENTPDVFINWNQSAKNIERFIRALNPFINAVTSYRGNFLKIHSAFVDDDSSCFEPGTIVDTNEFLGVATRKGILYISVLQASSFFIGQAIDFIRLSKCKIGEKLE